WRWADRGYSEGARVPGHAAKYARADGSRNLDTCYLGSNDAAGLAGRGRRRSRTLFRWPTSILAWLCLWRGGAGLGLCVNFLPKSANVVHAWHSLSVGALTPITVEPNTPNPFHCTGPLEVSANKDTWWSI